MGALIGTAFDTLVRMAAFAAQSLVALALALSALVLAAVGFAAMMLSALARIVTDMVHALSGISAELVKVCLVSVLVIVVAWSFPAVWKSYRGDVPALLPAAVATLVPIAYATTFKPIWSGLVFAITAAGLAGVIVPHLHPITLAFLVGGARAVGVLQELDQENRHGEQKQILRQAGDLPPDTL